MSNFPSQKASMPDSLVADSSSLLEFVNSTPVGLVVFRQIEGDDYAISSLNDTMLDFMNSTGIFKRSLGRPATAEDCIKMSMKDFMLVIDPEYIPNVHALLKEARTKTRTSTIIKVRSGLLPMDTYVQVRCKAVTTGDGKRQLFAVYDNITSQVENELALRESNYHDRLTGVQNRNAYIEAIEANTFSLEENSGRRPSSAGVIFCDVNGLKKVNDTLGHNEGDNLILRVSRVLLDSFPFESVYRISGDEFVVIVFNRSKDEFDNAATSLISKFEQSEEASAGGLWQENPDDLLVLVEKAEDLMRIAKKNYYRDHLDDVSKHRPLLLVKLLEDIDNNLFRMYLQPKADICGTAVIGAEALARRLDGHGNIIMPDHFIAYLEKTNLISYIDFFMFEEACRLLTRWKKEGRPPLKISVNMSRITLSEPDYVNRIAGICGKYDFDHGLLEFEVTESTETIDNMKFKDVIADIIAEGFTMSVDDMGSEHSTLGMIALDGIDTIKIDRSLILQIEEKKGRILLEYIINMCHALGKKCLAEGVETDEVRQKLQDMGCDSYQGYYLSKPIPIGDFEEKFHSLKAGGIHG